MTTATYHVEGMSCGGCVKHVEKALKGVPGVTAVQVNLAAATATVEGAVPYEQLAAPMDAAGYKLLPPA